MFCFIWIIVFIFAYLLFQKDNQISSKYLAATLILNVMMILSMILYLSKDTYYYNIVSKYFSLPKIVWKTLMFLDFPKDYMIRMLNLSSLAVIYFGYEFSCTYQTKIGSHRFKHFNIILPILFLFQLIIYDPYVQYKIYFFVYPNILNINQISIIMEKFHMVTILFNMGIILMSMINLCATYKKIYRIRFIRSFFLGEGICYMLIMLSYMLIFWFAPTFLIKVSKVADYKIYLSVPLSDNHIIYTIYPYYLFIASILCAACVYKVEVVKDKMKVKNFTITKQIDAAQTTSKSFCHYMKNEILAIESEIEMLEVSKENEEGIQEVLSRCEHLYQRLNVIHRSTKESELNLVETDMVNLMNEMLENMKNELLNFKVFLKADENMPPAMVDPIYFEQAVRNIIENAMDAMENVTEDRKQIIIRLEAINNWIILSIEDQGVGMNEKNLKNIFTPLYSSKPITKHWGIGLSLTHRIIMAHDGKIEVDSKENMGTNFRILLPNIKDYFS